MRVSASLGGRIAALGLVLMLLAIAVFVIVTMQATRASVDQAHDASDSSRAYQDARYRLVQLQVATQVHLTSPTPESRLTFNTAVDSMLAALARVQGVGTPADRAAIAELYADTAPSLEVVKRIFAAIEKGEPITEEVPSIDIATRYEELLQPLAVAYESAAERELHNLEVRQARATRITVVVAAAGLVAALGLLFAIQQFGHKATVQELEAVQLRTAALQDSLTGLGNHRAFREELRRQYMHSSRHHGEMSLVMIDVDRFKEVNDTWGHGRGDEVLRSIAKILRRESREDDYCFRIGGDEFAMILPNTGGTAAIAVLDRVREAAHIERPQGPTLSAGIASTARGNEQEDQLQEQADTALYEAKSRGRDTVVLFELEPEPDFAAADHGHHLLAG